MVKDLQDSARWSGRTTANWLVWGLHRISEFA
jgi:hypothetical protein